MRRTRILSSGLFLSLGLAGGLTGCDKPAMDEKFLDAADARAQAICACKDGDAMQGLECVKKAKADHPELEGRPAKQDVSEESWAAWKGFGSAAHKCEMGVKSRYNAAKKTAE